MASLWEICGRKLPLNSIKELEDLNGMCCKIVENCLAFPGNEKYRALKFESRSLQTRVLDKEGGLEFLLIAGFVVSMIDNEKKLVLQDSSGLAQALDWLQDTIATCSQWAETRAALPNESCCDCIIQLRLPTGAVIRGGFTSDESLRTVLSFARCYFQDTVKDAIQLRAAQFSASFSPGDMPKSLAELQLTTRALLIVSIFNDEEMGRRFQQKDAADVTERREVVNEQRRVGESAAAERRLEAQRIVRQFREDRENAKLGRKTES